MKAAYISAYGGADKVEIGERPKPEALSGQLLIKMKAASVNPIDWKTVNGDLKAIIDSTFSLDQVGAAFKRSMTGRAQGKIIITMNE